MADVRIDWHRVVSLSALLAGLSAGGLALETGKDRYYGADAKAFEREVKTRLEYIARQTDKIEKRLDNHLGDHPDVGLQMQINELRETQIRQHAGERK